MPRNNVGSFRSPPRARRKREPLEDPNAAFLDHMRLPTDDKRWSLEHRLQGTLNRIAHPRR